MTDVERLREELAEVMCERDRYREALEHIADMYWDEGGSGFVYNPWCAATFAESVLEREDAA